MYCYFNGIGPNPLGRERGLFPPSGCQLTFLVHNWYADILVGAEALAVACRFATLRRVQDEARTD